MRGQQYASVGGAVRSSWISTAVCQDNRCLLLLFQPFLHIAVKHREGAGAHIQQEFVEFLQIKGAFQLCLRLFPEQEKFQVTHIIFEILGGLADDRVIKGLAEFLPLVTEIHGDDLTCFFQ